MRDGSAGHAFAFGPPTLIYLIINNMKLTGFASPGIVCFGIATFAFGIQNFIYGDFVMGRAPSGGLVWAYVSGTLLTGAGVAMLLRKGWTACIVVGLMVFFWALLRHILAGHFNWGTEITQTGKAWTLFGGALTTAAFMPKDFLSRRAVRGNYSDKFILVGRVGLAAFMVICGIEHFMFVESVKLLVPQWIPGDVFWTWFAGVALIAGGVGLLVPKTMTIAALLSGVMVFIWFLILHIPRAIFSQGGGNEWIAVFEALAVSGIAFLLASADKGVET